MSSCFYRSIGFACGGLAYAAVLAELAAPLRRAGGASLLLAGLGVAGLVLWPAVGVALAYTNGRAGRRLFWGLMIGLYAVAGMAIAALVRGVGSAVPAAPAGEALVALALVFLTGQALIGWTYWVERPKWDRRAQLTVRRNAPMLSRVAPPGIPPPAVPPHDADLDDWE